MEKISSKFAEMNTYNILHTHTHTHDTQIYIFLIKYHVPKFFRIII